MAPKREHEAVECSPSAHTSDGGRSPSLSLSPGPEPLARLHEQYRFGCADVEIILTPSIDFDDDCSFVSYDELPGRPVKYLVHGRNLAALSSVFAELLSDAEERREAAVNKKGIFPKRIKIGTTTPEEPEEKPRLKLEIEEDPEIFDAFLPYFYRGGIHILEPPNLDYYDISFIMNLARMAEKYEVGLVQDLLSQRLCHWIPTAKGRGDLTTKEAFDIYRYAASANDNRLKEIAKEATYSKRGYKEILSFNRDDFETMDAEDVDALWRYHARQNSHKTLFLKAAVAQIEERPVSGRATDPDAAHLQDCEHKGEQHAEWNRVIYTKIAGNMAYWTHDRRQLCKKLEQEFTEEKEPCPRCRQNIEYRIESLRKLP